MATIHAHLRCGVVLVIAILPFSAAAGTEVDAITKPSADLTLSFVQPGRIAEVAVREGDRVKADQLLVRQDDRAELLRLEQLQAQSENLTQVAAAQASLEQRTVDLKKLEWAAERGAATELEVEHARLEVKIADLSLKLARFEHEQNGRRYREAKVRVENMRLKSPVAGRVETVAVEVGESVNVMEEAVRVVRIDPLWIDAHVQLSAARSVAPASRATVRFPGAEGSPVEGSVIFVSSVADAASATLRVRVQVPNRDGRPAGERVTVVFQDPAAGR
jgi:RND family efflux transporter MFP subunit